MKISIVIVTYNSARFLPDCLASIKDQSFQDFEIIVIDNSVNNLGLCRANNQGIRRSKGEYILIMNPDVVLKKDFLEKIIEQAEKLPQGGSFGPKLLRLINNEKTDIIDSTGLKVLPHYKIIDRGAGKQDKGQFEKTEEVFGISGACALYRRKAIDFFDEQFFVYKEDIDMAWMLKEKGWQNWYIPEAVAYHQRAIFLGKERKKRNRLINYYSYRNHLLLLAKHLDKKTFWQNSWRIIPYEFGKFIYILFFETRNIRGFFEFLKLWTSQ